MRGIRYKYSVVSPSYLNLLDLINDLRKDQEGFNDCSEILLNKRHFEFFSGCNILNKCVKKYMYKKYMC